MLFAFQLGAITNADNIELFGPPGRDARDGIEHQGPCQAMKTCLRVVLALDQQIIVFL